MDEFRRDVELLNALRPIVSALAQAQELLEDTYLEVGSEAYAAALAVYGYARASGKGSALDAALDGLARRFARKTAKTTADQPK